MKKVFEDFRAAVQKQFAEMKGSELFRTTPGKGVLWRTYLSSFPEGTNPIYKERTEFDCQCCKNFIRTAGDAVTISDSGEVVSIWDVEVGGHFQVVADALSACVKASQISDKFLHFEPTVGQSETHQQLEDGGVKTWSHFFLELPSTAVLRKDAIPTKLGKVRSIWDVFARSLREISVEALETVLELVDQNSLYRGQENRFAVAEFLKSKREYNKLGTQEEKDLYCWTRTGIPSSVATIRNTAIGTLLVDLSEDKDLDAAVRSFEAKVAPANYKRPTALISKAMIKKAQQAVEDLGFLTALDRRYAVVDDVTVNNVLFADRIAKQEMSVFDELAESVSENVQSLDKVEVVDIETFIAQVLPGSTSVELLLENRHARSLVSLVAPVHSDSKCMFKWDNGFSWAYVGELADSIKERVKNAGGNVEGDLRCSLSWFNTDDLDIHMDEPGGDHLFYGHKNTRAGNLDVDMNVNNLRRDAVENITYANRETMAEGRYELYVHNYTKRESVDVGFELEIEFDGVIHTFGYEKAVGKGKKVLVALFDYSHEKGITFIESLPSSQASKKIWGLPTQSFHRVSMVMNSPNHWDGHGTGNKHYFFMLQDCVNADRARGFFNEFLSDSLREHRKVFEVLGSKMKTPESGNQLSGLGFSSTQREHVFCRVTGSFSRVIKLTF